MKRLRSLFVLFLAPCLLTDSVFAIPSHALSQVSDFAFQEQALTLQIGSAEHDMDVPARDTVGFRRFILGMSAWWGRFGSEAGSVPTRRELTPGQYLAKRMKAEGLTQSELAIRTGLSQKTISCYQRDIFLPSQENANLMMKELKSSITYFWNEIVRPYAKRKNKFLVFEKRLGNRKSTGPRSIVPEIIPAQAVPRVDAVGTESAWIAFRRLIGIRILEKRLDLKWTQEELSEKSHIRQKTISKIECMLRGGTVNVFLALAKGLGLAPEALFDPRPSIKVNGTLPPSHEITSIQMHLNLRELIWQNHDLNSIQSRVVLAQLKLEKAIQLRTIYFSVIQPLSDRRKLADLFKKSLTTPPKDGPIRQYSEEEEKFYKALKNQDRSPAALRFKLAYRMLEEQFPRLAHVLNLYLLQEEDLTLEKIGRLLDPNQIVSRERIHQLKNQAFTFLTVVTTEVLQPLMLYSLMHFELFGINIHLRKKLKPLHIYTLSDLLAAIETDRLAQNYTPGYVHRIMDAVAAIKAALNSAPQIPLHSSLTSA